MVYLEHLDFRASTGNSVSVSGGKLPEISRTSGHFIIDARNCRTFCQLKILTFARASPEIGVFRQGNKKLFTEPLRVIQKILGKIFQHLLHFIGEQFHLRFSQLSTSVTGIEEAFSWTTNSKMGN